MSDISNPTKYYSSRQERAIADYLGWDVVSGSGSRAFNPGDVRSENYLGECKTHTDCIEKIVVSTKVLDKIFDEAKSVFKTPVLFTDNGMQQISNTWCIVPEVCLPETYTSIESSLVKKSKTRISFDHNAVKEYYKMGTHNFIGVIFGSKRLVIVPLDVFKTIIDGDVDA